MTIDCIDWQGALYGNGYGRLYLRGSKPYRDQLAHRWAWEQANGPIPPGLVVMHACDNRKCVNVEHLKLGCQADNVADMRAKGRARGKLPPERRRQACPFGHRYAEHGRLDRNGHPKCRACDARRQRERRALYGR